MTGALSFTDNAARKVRDLVAAQGRDAPNLRVYIQGGGCSGFQYGFTFEDEADDDDMVTFPVGLGITKTFRIGKTPWKVRLEPQYTLVRPDSFGEKWNIRFQIAPVINSPFSGGFGGRRP